MFRPWTRANQDSNFSKEINRVNASTTPAHCLERMSMQQHREENPVDLNVLTEMKRQNSRVQEANAARILWCETLMRTGLHRESVPKTLKEVPRVLISEHI